MAKCLVLGANGFIGSHLVDQLRAANHEVRAFDRFRDDTVRFNADPAIDVVSGDFLNRNDLHTALEGMEYVFHFISTTTPITSDADPLIDVETNIRMSIELLQECTESTSVKRVIFASTGGAIYGLNSSELTSEEITPLPISPYAIGKLTIEHYLRYFEKKHCLSSLVYRISNPYGTRQNPQHKQGVIPIFLKQLADGEPLTIMGDGTMVRDYLYVEDVAALITNSFQQAKANLYNLGSGHGVSVNDLVAVMQSVTGKQIQQSQVAVPPTFVEKIVLDTSKFEHEFNQKPATSLEDGIKKTWDYISTL